MYDWTEEALTEFRMPLVVTASLTAFLNVFPIVFLLRSIILIKRWIKVELDGIRRWKWRIDGLFAIYLIFFTALFIVEVAILCWLLVTGLFSNLSYNVDYAGKLEANHRIVSLSMIYSALNFIITMHVLFMFEKMSRAVWSNMLPEEQKSSKTTQMDREVAAGWFDEMLVDTDYKFVDFLHNIPYGDDSLPLSQRSS